MKFKFWPSSKVMRFSLLGFILCIVLSLLSMGLLGTALFFVAAPTLEIFFPQMSSDLNTISGNWVWPTMIGMPLLWSVGWLMAGRAYLHVDALDWTNMTKKTGYVVILLIWNLLVWLFLLSMIRPDVT